MVPQMSRYPNFSLHNIPLENEYIHIQKHTPRCTPHLHTHSCTLIHTHVHIHMPTCTHIWEHIHFHSHTLIHRWNYTYIPSHTCIHTHVCIHTHMYNLTCTHTHTPIHFSYIHLWTLYTDLNTSMLQILTMILTLVQKALYLPSHCQSPPLCGFQ